MNTSEIVDSESTISRGLALHLYERPPVAACAATAAAVEMTMIRGTPLWRNLARRPKSDNHSFCPLSLSCCIMEISLPWRLSPGTAKCLTIMKSPVTMATIYTR